MNCSWKPFLSLCSILIFISLALPARGAAPRQVDDWLRIAKTGHPIARRRAARKVLAVGAPARAAIMVLVHSDDRVIKRAALRRLVPLFGRDAFPALRAALRDPDPLVRIVAVEELLALQPRTEEIKKLLLRVSTEDDDMNVRNAAAGAFWTFHRDVVPLRKRIDWDHPIEVIARLPLPKGGLEVSNGSGPHGSCGRLVCAGPRRERVGRYRDREILA